MQVGDIGAVQAAQAKQTTAPGNGLGKDAFLQILMAQMRHQDPLNPADGSAMVAQLAQFGTMEQLQNINEKIEALFNLSLLGETSAMIGKDITYVSMDSNIRQGRVESVLWYGTESLLRINGELVPIGAICEIGVGEENA
jgi:flagellar basal-body rod modification protein FlgD